VILLVGLFFGTSLYAQKNAAPPASVTIPPAEGERQARSLIADLLAQKPTENSHNTGSVQIRDADGKKTPLAATFEVVITTTNYQTIYRVAMPAGGEQVLTIYHSGTQANQYFLNSKQLSESELMSPFAGSDFWVADLGLDFLHWPQQRIIKKEMRRNVFCAVLESINPNPGRGGYARVLSWIGTSHPDETVLVHADAFDDHGDRIKQFDPKNLEKINGSYQLESMQMRNEKAGSRTIIEFNLKKERR